MIDSFIPDSDVASVRPDITVTANDVNVEETFVILGHVIPKSNALVPIIRHFLGNRTYPSNRYDQN